jgi:hypothetical protein
MDQWRIEEGMKSGERPGAQAVFHRLLYANKQNGQINECIN